MMVPQQRSNISNISNNSNSRTTVRAHQRHAGVAQVPIPIPIPIPTNDSSTRDNDYACSRRIRHHHHHHHHHQHQRRHRPQQHGIEAVVFSVEDFSVTPVKRQRQQQQQQQQQQRRPWKLGCFDDGAAAAAAAPEGSTAKFDMRRKQRWIFYDTAEDLTRKVDALFRRARTWSSEEFPVGKIRDRDNSKDRDVFDFDCDCDCDCDCAETIASTSPSSTTAPLTPRFPSSNTANANANATGTTRYRYRDYNHSEENCCSSSSRMWHRPPSFHSVTWPFTEPSSGTEDRYSSNHRTHNHNHNHNHNRNRCASTNHRHNHGSRIAGSNSSNDNRERNEEHNCDDDSLPDFLKKGLTFKQPSRRTPRAQPGVIAIPPSTWTSASPPPAMIAIDDDVDVDIAFDDKLPEDDAPDFNARPCGRFFRRLGRRTRDWWNKLGSIRRRRTG